MLGLHPLLLALVARFLQDVGAICQGRLSSFMMQRGFPRARLIVSDFTAFCLRVGSCKPKIYDACECCLGLFSTSWVRTIVLRTLTELH